MSDTIEYLDFSSTLKESKPYPSIVILDDVIESSVCDKIISEPKGGAHRDPIATMQSVGKALAKILDDLAEKSPSGLMHDRRQKFLDVGTKGLAV